MLALTGCATLAPEAPSFSSTSSSSGRFAYELDPVALTGDFTFRKGEDFALELKAYKAGGVTLFTVSRVGGTWYFASGLDGRRWSGQPDTAPDLVRSWIAVTLALEASAALDAGTNEVQTHLWQGLFQKSGNRLDRATIRTMSGATFRLRML